MLGPVELAESIYVGDRGLMSISIDGHQERVAFLINTISRLRLGTQSWDYYTERDIENGLIVLTGVKSIRFEPTGPIPNDYINALSVNRPDMDEAVTDTPLPFILRMSVSSVANDGTSCEVLIEVTATGMHLEDPLQPGVEIRE